MQTADGLRNIFGCIDDAELGALFGRTGGAVSVWRKNGVPAAIERRANELMLERGLLISEQHETYSAEEQEIIDITKNHPLIKLALTEMVRLSEEKQFKYWQEMRDEARKLKEMGGDTAAHKDSD